MKCSRRVVFKVFDLKHARLSPIICKGLLAIASFMIISNLIGQDCFITKISEVSGLTESHKLYPDIDETGIVWANSIFPYNDIYFYNGQEVINVSSMNPDSNFINTKPKISGDKIVWQAFTATIGHHIYLYDGNAFTNISDIEETRFAYNLDPIIDGSIIVWTGLRSATARHIFYYNGEETLVPSELFDEGIYNSKYHEISGKNIVWQASDGRDEHIYFFNGKEVKKLSALGGTHTTDNSGPKIDGSNVVWQGKDEQGEQHIYVYQENTVTKVSALFGHTSRYNSSADISGNNIVWEGFNDDTLSQVFLFDGLSIKSIGPSTEIGSGPKIPRIHGENIVYKVGDNSGIHLYYYDGDTTKRISEADINFNYEINQNGLVWSGYNNSSRLSDVFFYDCRGTNIVPTIGEWSTIIIALCMLILSILYIKSTPDLTFDNKCS